VLVTGRELPELKQVFPELELFDWVVAENGGLLYQPRTGLERPLTSAPAPELVDLLRSRNVPSLSVGRTVIATWEPYETVVLEAIRELGLELQVTFNKGAVMVLPSGVNKRTGLEAALSELGLSLHNTVGIGDAENDHAFLSACECSVAVANALPAVKAAVDHVTQAHHGAGVQELIEHLLTDDLESLEPSLGRHHIALGARRDGSELSMPAHRGVVMFAGQSGAGKSTAVSGLLERLATSGYQLCVIDPEGDYESFESAVVVGTPEQTAEPEQVIQILERAQSSAVANLLGVPPHDRPVWFVRMWGRLKELRARVSRPHWLVVDEVHHMLGDTYEPAPMALPEEPGPLIAVTVNPEHVHVSLLRKVDLLVAVGKDAVETLAAFARATQRAVPSVSEVPQQAGQVLVWRTSEEQAELIAMPAGQSTRERHRRKYAQGELAAERCFYFRGPEARLNLRAHNLLTFTSLAEGVDDDTWLYHLLRGDYSRWMREIIRDAALADEVSQVESSSELSPRESRHRIGALIDSRYTLPA
jgi:hydroxymethylpyrimidine pyrophosphatase-like HAD family hydrolase